MLELGDICYRRENIFYNKLSKYYTSSIIATRNIENTIPHQFESVPNFVLGSNTLYFKV